MNSWDRFESFNESVMSWISGPLEPDRAVPHTEVESFIRSKPAEKDGVVTRLSAANAMMASVGVGAWDRSLTMIRSLRGKIYGRAEEAIFDTAGRKLRRELPSVYQALMESRRLGGYGGDGQYGRLWELGLLLRRFAPTSCLELGSGVTSAVFAEYCGSRVPFTTVEESPEWYANQRKFLDQFAKHCNSVLAPGILTEFDGIPVVHYDIPHDVQYDLVYIDGPNCVIHDKLTESQRAAARSVDLKGRLASVDVELMWRNDRLPRVILVDGRSITLIRLAAMRQAQEYQFFLKTDYDRLPRVRSPRDYLFHSVLVRR